MVEQINLEIMKKMLSDDVLSDHLEVFIKLFGIEKTIMALSDVIELAAGKTLTEEQCEAFNKIANTLYDVAKIAKGTINE